MNGHEAFKRTAKKLHEAGIPSARFEAAQLIDFLSDEAEEVDFCELSSLVERRLSGEPLQYVLGMWEFYSLPFYVGEGVLIPRPDTEILVETAIEFIGKDKTRCIDLCAGSGCVGIAIDKNCENAEVEALEAEKAAIIRDSKELKEAAESGRYALKVAASVEDALHTLYTFQSEVFRDNRHNSIYRDHDLSLEIRNSRVRVENSLETLGRYLQDFAAELKDLIGQPEQVIPTAHIEEVLDWISRWVKNVTTKHHGGSHGVSPILGELTPLVCDLEQKYAEKEAACREIDERIRAMVIET